MKNLNITISGHVQGVNFRSEAKLMADNLAISGFARNEKDGSIYIQAQGEDSNLERFLSWCRVGPMNADVDNVEVVESAVTNYTNFEIK